jgi:hypothetical protein
VAELWGVGDRAHVGAVAFAGRRGGEVERRRTARGSGGTNDVKCGRTRGLAANRGGVGDRLRVVRTGRRRPLAGGHAGADGAAISPAPLDGAPGGPILGTFRPARRPGIGN